MHFNEGQPIPADYYETMIAMEHSKDGGKTIDLRVGITKDLPKIATLDSLEQIAQAIAQQLPYYPTIAAEFRDLQVVDDGKALVTPWHAEDISLPDSWVRYVVYLYRRERVQIPEVLKQTVRTVAQG